MAAETFRLELPNGHWIVGDQLAGEPPYYAFLHGLQSVRAGEKSAGLMAHAQARGRGFVRFDMRGHGESSGELGKVSVSELIADAIRVFERVGSVELVGSSLGGLISAHATAQRPDLVRRLALLAPALGLMSNIDHHLDDEGHMSTTEGSTFYVEHDVREDARKIDEAGLPKRIQTPTLTVHGTADDVIPPVVSEMFHAQLASEHKQLWIVPDGDHRLNTVAAEIWRRLDALPTGAGERS
ncbi:MAG: alpha/beta hydrolase [Planctomycetota bacterium]